MASALHDIAEGLIVIGAGAGLLIALGAVVFLGVVIRFNRNGVMR